MNDYHGLHLSTDSNNVFNLIYLFKDYYSTLESTHINKLLLWIVSYSNQCLLTVIITTDVMIAILMVIEHRNWFKYMY